MSLIARLIVVLAVALFVFLSAGLILLVRMVGWLRRRQNGGEPAPPASAARRWFERTVLALAAVGALCVGYGFVEPYWPEVTFFSKACRDWRKA